MTPLIVIPARYNSSRFPGKPLVDIVGKSMLLRVWELCVEVLEEGRVIVATDDQRIADHCNEQGIRYMMTPESCLTGTDRVAFVAKQIKADIYVNVQGDEPLVCPDDIRHVINSAISDPGKIFNAYTLTCDERDYSSANVPKVVMRQDRRLLYMSRSPLPGGKSRNFDRAAKQVCIYAIPFDALMAFASCAEKTPLESKEDIEILRFLELGFDVWMVEVSNKGVSVDMPEDVDRVVTRLQEGV